jgi:rubredoxin
MTDYEKAKVIPWLKNIVANKENSQVKRDKAETILEAYQELEQYRALGTVEELKEAREKQIPKTPNIEGDGYADGHHVYDTWICPNCETDYEIDYDDYDYCPKCGQAINKSVFEGEQEDA